jgi:SAM-dependent methyltransferase
MSESPGYIHGYTDAEADRLLAQAEFLAPYVLADLDLAGVDRLLEVGIGVGAETRLLRARWPHVRVTGVDVSQRSLERAQHVLSERMDGHAVALARASGARLPFADATFDAALFIWVLEHVPDPGAIFADVARCLKPGARVVASEVYNRSLLIEPRQPLIEAYFTALCEAQRRAGGHPDIAARLPLLAEAAGLTVAEFRWFAAHGDRRDRPRCLALIRYFEGLCRSAEPALRAAGLLPTADVAEVWAAFDTVCASPDALLCYIGGRLVATR